MNDRHKIIHGDCLEQMTLLPDKSVDVIVMDPPYCSGAVGEAARTAAKGQGLRSGNIKKLGWFVGDNMGTAGLVWLLRAVAIEGHRLLKGSGHLLFFCDWRMVPNLIPAVESAGYRYQNLIVWNKPNIGLGIGFRTKHELIVHMTCGAPEYFDKGTANVLDARRIGHLERASDPKTRRVDRVTTKCRLPSGRRRLGSIRRELHDVNRGVSNRTAIHRN